MSDQDWEALFDKYITEVVDDEQEHIKSHELPTAIKIRSLVSDSATQAAANKAAEEGGLPAIKTWRERAYEEIGEHWLGYKHDSFMKAEIEELRERVKNLSDRASRQVANKAEVEPVAPTFNYLLLDRLVSVDVSTCDEDAAHRIFAELTGDTASDGTTLIAIETSRNFATPPATTGASTVLTDERIDAILASVGPTAGTYSDSRELSMDKLRKFAREVAAQAGQVALPGWVSTDDRLPENGKDVIILYWPYDNHENERVAGTAHHVEGTFYDEDGNDMHPPSHWMPFVIPAAAPSPAKESK